MHGTDPVLVMNQLNQLQVQIDALALTSSSGYAVGTLGIFPLGMDVPPGWSPCDGSFISRTAWNLLGMSPAPSLVSSTEVSIGSSPILIKTGVPVEEGKGTALLRNTAGLNWDKIQIAENEHTIVAVSSRTSAGCLAAVSIHDDDGVRLWIKDGTWDEYEYWGVGKVVSAPIPRANFVDAAVDMDPSLTGNFTIVIRLRDQAEGSMLRWHPSPSVPSTWPPVFDDEAMGGDLQGLYPSHFTRSSHVKAQLGFVRENYLGQYGSPAYDYHVGSLLAAGGWAAKDATHIEIRDAAAGTINSGLYMIGYVDTDPEAWYGGVAVPTGETDAWRDPGVQGWLPSRSATIQPVDFALGGQILAVSGSEVRGHFSAYLGTVSGTLHLFASLHPAYWWDVALPATTNTYTCLTHIGCDTQEDVEVVLGSLQGYILRMVFKTALATVPSDDPGLLEVQLPTIADGADTKTLIYLGEPLVASSMFGGST